jgi:predicted metal-binding membrane protein
MAWIRMPGQTWPSAAASFLNMWIVMTLAMMLPALVPMLRRCRRAVVVGSGYLLVWTLAGAAVFAAGSTLAMLEMRQAAIARAVPLAAGVVVLLAGMFQFTRWKARQLARCRHTEQTCHELSSDFGAAWRHGLRIGLLCTRCCANLMAVLLVTGLMDLRAMTIMTAAISLERLAPAGERFARAGGAVIAAAGAVLIARAI